MWQIGRYILDVSKAYPAAIGSSSPFCIFARKGAIMLEMLKLAADFLRCQEAARVSRACRECNRYPELQVRVTFAAREAELNQDIRDNAEARRKARRQLGQTKREQRNRVLDRLLGRQRRTLARARGQLQR